MFELYRPTLRTSGAIAILLAWVASLGWLGWRRLNESEAATLSAAAILRLAPGSTWYTLMAGATQIGNASISLDTLSPGYRVDQTVTYEVVQGDSLARTTRRTETWLGATLNLERVVSRLSRVGRQADWRLSIFADTVTAHFTAEGVIASGRAHFGDAPTATTALAYRLALGGALQPGHSRLVMLIDGWPIAGRSVELTVGRDSLFRYADSATMVGAHWVAAHSDSTRAFAVVIRSAGGVRRYWIDRRGTVAGIDTPLGVRWVRTDFDLSETEYRNTLGERAATIRASEPVLAQYASATKPVEHPMERRFVVRHRDGSPVDTALLALFAGGRQEVHGDTIIERQEPVVGAETEADAPPDPMIQEDAAAITTLARTLLGRSPDRPGIQAMLTTLHGMIRVDTAIAAREDALGTLAARGGRADGVARLAVALLRDAGVPARYVIGVEPRGDTLLTHAWAEVWNPTSGGWYPVDPSLGTATASSRLIRLAFGGSSHPDEMLPMIANARFIEIPPARIP